jgi:hypothetical protein
VGRKIGRNEPCWCGSGLKYKRCHLDRDKQEPVNPWNADNEFRRAFSEKTCSVPAAFRMDCVGHPIRAHTIPRAASLKRIARGGHVYGFVPSFKKLTEYDGRVPPELIGVNRASTFTGFCAKHDTELFTPLETERFTGTAEQCFLLGYRALAREIYTKKASASLSDLRSQADKGRDEHDQFHIQMTNFLFNAGLAAGNRDNELHKGEFDKRLTACDYNDVQAFIVALESVPDVMCSAGIFPERTFSNTPLQDIGDVETRGQLLTLSSFADDDGGYIVLTWLPDSDEVCSQFVKSLDSIPDETLTSALIRLMFEYCENVFIRPEWWESLSTNQQVALVNRMNNMVDHLTGKKESGDLSDDGVRFPAWVVRYRRYLR